MTGQKQHVDLFRKIRLRDKLLKLNTERNPVAYVPFIGDGDLAVRHYSGFRVYGADLDPERVAIARPRVTGHVIVSDCDIWPFPNVSDTFTVGDFDAYSHPYRSFRSFWANTSKADRLILFFTDANRQAIFRTGNGEHPSGKKLKPANVREKRLLANFWFKKHVFPWFADYIQPYRVIKKAFYLRAMMLY